MDKWKTTIVGGVEVRINTDRRVWLDYTRAARDYTFYQKVIDRAKATEKMNKCSK